MTPSMVSMRDKQADDAMKHIDDSLIQAKVRKSSITSV